MHMNYSQIMSPVPFASKSGVGGSCPPPSCYGSAAPALGVDCSRKVRNVDEMFMTRSLNVTPKTTEQHLIVRNDKSVAYVTNNNRLRSTFSTIEANY